MEGGWETNIRRLRCPSVAVQKYGHLVWVLETSARPAIMSASYPTFIRSTTAWVHTDISYYAKLEDIKEHLEAKYPTTFDHDRERHVQNWEITVRLFADRPNLGQSTNKTDPERWHLSCEGPGED